MLDKPRKKAKVAKGIQVAVSPRAHEAIKQKAFNSKPRLNLREYLNVIHNVPKDA